MTKLEIRVDLLKGRKVSIQQSGLSFAKLASYLEEEGLELMSDGEFYSLKHC